MDVLTLFGLIMGFGVVYYVMLQGQITALLFNINAFFLVFGGTLASTLITYPWDVLKHVPRALLFVISPPKQNAPYQLIQQMVDLQTVATGQGIDGLSTETENINDRFLRSGIRMLIEDQDEESIRENLDNEIVATRQRHQRIVSVFRSMGAYSPIFGLLGTLIGVVQVLRNLSDATAMGSSMAIAWV
jgi:chemotaxis protein MotA